MPPPYRSASRSGVITGFDVADHQVAADCAGVVVPLWQRRSHLLLCGVIVGDGEGRQLIRISFVFAVSLDEAWTDIRELEPLLDHGRPNRAAISCGPLP